MKIFFKYVFASCFGTILAFGAIFLFFFIIAMSSAPQDTVSSGSTLHIKLDEVITELAGNVEVSGFSSMAIDNLGLNEIKAAIKNAANDRKINGLLIETQFPNVGQSTALSIFMAIKEFKKSGKPVMAYGEYFSQNGYLFASVADTVAINPNGMMDIRGFGMLIPYYGDFIKKIGAKVDIYHAGQYKSAIEPYYRSSSSPQNDYQSTEFLNDWEDQWIANVTEGRVVTPEILDRIIKNGTIVTADIAVESGLADKKMYRKDFNKMLLAAVGRKKLKYIDLAEYINLTFASQSSSSSNKVAVVNMEGIILNNKDEKGVISMEVYGKVFDRLIKKKDVKAVVLRVNSGGGDALVSDNIWDRVEELKEAGKYVVASFGDYAASGGYYISCGADKIVSMPNTLTGSIGVYSMIPDFSGAIADNLGIYFDSIGTGENTFMYSTMVPRNAAQNRKLQASTEVTYQKFLKRVADGRGKSKEDIHKVAQGRVWSGEDAIGAGLVDTLGDLDVAIAIAAKGAGYDDNYKMLTYPIIEKTFYEEILEGLGEMENVKMLLGINTPKLLDKKILDMAKMMTEKQLAKPQTRLPFIIEVN
ncbi:MAG: signal peptide peptidase SppA [Saprospiraceae bacterium]